MLPWRPMESAAPQAFPAPGKPWRWDIFCTVVDNFGDIGVCWRLARQLATEHGIAVCLWVDDLKSFARLCPAVAIDALEQSVAGIRIRHWQTPFPEVEAAQVVIEAFACELPEAYLAAMARCTRPPVWLNLEYLTAEDWAAHCHSVASPHPRLPLIKYFFFPGFDGRTGGLLREQELETQRTAFLADAAAQADLWRRVGTAPRDGERPVSLFCYGHLPIQGLLENWSKGPDPILCLAPLGPALPQINAWSGGRLQGAGDCWQQGALRLMLMNFLPQEDYDRLLWACDLNFVRGEDSFVRAQWAARPLVWQIYPQEAEAHAEKLAAFIDTYTASLEPAAATSLRAFWMAWNGLAEAPTGDGWGVFMSHLPALAEHAKRWRSTQSGQPDLAESLVRFCRNKL